MGANPFFTFQAYISHLITSKGRHGTHSPFVYGLIEQVILPYRSFVDLEIESITDQLKKQHQYIESIEPKTGIYRKKRLSHIARKSSSTLKFRSFLAGLCQYLDIKTVLETGTSLGFATAYMAKSPSKPMIHTIEGDQTIAQIAQNTWQTFENINFHIGNLQDNFSDLVSIIQPELIFLDADHRSEALHFCFEKMQSHLKNVQVIIIHDIYWSRDMNNAWKQIVKRSDLPLTIDIFQAGLVFPNMNMPKQHFKLNF